MSYIYIYMKELKTAPVMPLNVTRLCLIYCSQLRPSRHRQSIHPSESQSLLQESRHWFAKFFVFFFFMEVFFFVFFFRGRPSYLVIRRRELTWTKVQRYRTIMQMHSWNTNCTQTIWQKKASAERREVCMCCAPTLACDDNTRPTLSAALQG